MKSFTDFVEQRRKKRAVQYQGATFMTHDAHCHDPFDPADQFQGSAYPSHDVPVRPHDPRLRRIKEDEDSGYPKREVKNFDHLDYYKWEADHANKHIAPSIDTTQDYLHEKHPYAETPHPHEVYAYTAGSRYLNKTLWQHYKRGDDPGSHVHPPVGDIHDLGLLDHAVGHHKLGTDLHVFRGIGSDADHPWEKASEDPKNRLHMPAYTSTSISKSAAWIFTDHLKDSQGKWANHMLHLHLKSGQPGLFIGQYSKYHTEGEFLLPRHTTIQLHPKPEIIAPRDHDSSKLPLYLWHGHVVPTLKR
jgi:hypothetical protein